MFSNPSLITRVAIGKLIGLACGVAAFIFVPCFLPDAGGLLRWGLLLWYITFGAIIGVMGVFTSNPVINLPLPWWFRGSLLGAWLNFVLVFFAYDQMHLMMLSLFGQDGVLTSPFWFVLEGAIIGFVMDYLATRFGGEGPDTTTIPR